jgi:hypothetical protein
MEIIIYIYNGQTALDAVGCYEVLSRLPNANVKFVGKEKGVIVTDTHFLKLVAVESTQIDTKRFTKSARKHRFITKFGNILR